ncbi:MAG: endonuclease/exonuclease/phosphatase family protein [Chitinophagaceae bacterium]|nr:endonuclease/exonuclease/phosphatase family protein [Chitinophagaceae bacterium]
MALKLRNFFKSIWLIVTITAAALLLLSCLSPFLNPYTWWPFSALSVLFPFFLLLNIIILLANLVFSKFRHVLISVLALAMSYKNIRVFWAFNKPKPFQHGKDSATLRVLCWNVARFIEMKKNNNEGSMKRKQMLDLIREQNADILCLQEFHTSVDSLYYDNISPVQQMGYPYFYFSYDEDGDRHYYSSIIFSKFPIADSGKVRYPRPTLPEVLLFADIVFRNDTIRIFNTHLQSYQLFQQDYERLKKVTKGEDSMVYFSGSLLKKMKRGIQYRAIHARTLREVTKNSPYPSVICLDMNDIPYSYNYFLIKNGLQDAFLKKGTGIGRTYNRLLPTLRIDYIFADRRFKVVQFKRNNRPLSDHSMLVADLKLEP